MAEELNAKEAADYSLEEINEKDNEANKNESTEQAETTTKKTSIKTADLSLILDIPLKLSVIFGKSKMRINDLLQLGQGSVIELDKEVGEPLEIYANDKLLAYGEVVVINDKFGIKLLNIVSPEERITKLK
ncbi:MAG: flagellar motor switch protein FliN [Candidatus Schekmanbacteria bacterium]|nr:MAG: flagellar motor switch protein FliN [Candidatus Schekmanbacteria bacterium]